MKSITIENFDDLEEVMRAIAEACKPQAHEVDETEATYPEGYLEIDDDYMENPEPADYDTDEVEAISMPKSQAIVESCKDVILNTLKGDEVTESQARTMLMLVEVSNTARCL